MSPDCQRAVAALRLLKHQAIFSRRQQIRSVVEVPWKKMPGAGIGLSRLYVRRG